MTATVEQDRDQTAEASNGEALEIAPSKPAAALIRFGHMPETLQGAWIMANVYSKSQMVPKDYIQKPHNIMIAWDLGLSLGFTPMQSLQSIAVIGNRPGVWGDGFLALCRAAPTYRDHDEYYMVAGERREIHDGVTAEDLKRPDTKAVCLFYVRDRERPYGGSFSVEQAQRAGLIGKDSPWKTYTERMLLMRARGFAGRDAFPGQLRGIKTVEELRDIPPDIDVTAQPVAEPVRRSAKLSGAPDAQSIAEADEVTGEIREAEEASANESEAPEPSVLTNELPPEKSATTKAPPATAAAKSAGRSATTKAGAVPDGVIKQTNDLAFTDSAFVQPKGVEPFFELRAVIQAEGQAPVGYTFRTRDESLYKLAESCEGTGKTFRVKWHQGQTADGSKCKVIDAIEAD